MTEREALDYAIFAINTILYPEASDPDDLDRLEERADEVITALATRRRELDR